MGTDNLLLSRAITTKGTKAFCFTFVFFVAFVVRE